MNKYFIYLIMLALTGCFHDDEEQFSLDGVWVSSCYSVLPISQVLFGISTMTFSSPDLKQEVTLFNDSSCSQEPREQETFLSTYMIGDKVITSGGIEAREIISESKGDSNYSIFGLIENKLYFGDSDSSEDTNYPTKLEYSVYFIKQ